MALILEVTAQEMREMLRIGNEKLDAELYALKGAFLSDLSMAGVQQIPEGDSLPMAALRMYLRWQENYNGEAERYEKAYQGVKIAMALAGEYRGGASGAE